MKQLAPILLYLLAATAGAATYPPVTVDMALQRVSEHVYYVQGAAGTATENQGFISNAAAIVTDKGLVIVDTLGSPPLAQRFLDLLGQVTDKPVLTVITTHYHADHIYGLQVFQDLGARVLAPAGFRDYLDAPTAEERLAERRVSLYPWVNENTRLVRPDEVVTQDRTLDLGDVQLELTYLGAAHSDGDLSVLVMPDRVLISGDIIFEGRVPFTGNANTRNWIEVLEQINKGGLAGLVPGHGPAARDPDAALALTLHYLKYTRAQMGAAVEEMVPFAEAYEKADWSEFQDLPAFDATHRRNAFGIYLSLEQEQFEH